MLKGIFLSDIHFSDFLQDKCESIDITPVYAYIKDFKPDLIILGGDIIDAKGLHGVESFTPTQFKLEWYKRDCALLQIFMRRLNEMAPNAKYVYLIGNHEERYDRLINKYPDLFRGKLNLIRDGVPKHIQNKMKFIPYGTYESFYKLGDCVFLHGDIYPDQHAKKYAQAHSPYKVWYGHLHDIQIYSQQVAGPQHVARYAGTAGCLSKRAPEWKKGMMHKWVNGFADFMVRDGITTITPHVIENGWFYVGNKIYGK